MGIRPSSARLVLIAALAVSSLGLLAAGTPAAAGSRQEPRASAGPGAPTAKAPTGAVVTTKPAFTWGKVTGATRYEVRVYADKTLTLKKTGIKKSPWTSGTALPRDVALTWKVRAGNARGTGAWSKSRSFRGRAPGLDDIAYSLDGDLWAISPDGGESVQLTSGSSWDYGVAWSPDRGRVAFIRQPSRGKSWLENGVIWVLDCGTGVATRLQYSGPSLATAGDDLAWSPDGRFLGGGSSVKTGDYSSCALAVLDLQTMQSRIVRVFDAWMQVRSVSWAPNSQRLVACVQNTDPGLTYLMDVTSGEILHDYDFGVGNAYTVSWSPDGQYMMFFLYGLRPGLDFNWNEIRTPAGALVATMGAVGYDFDYSPDSRQYAYPGYEGRKMFMMRAAADGSGVVKIAQLHPRNAAAGLDGLAWK